MEGVSGHLPLVHNDGDYYEGRDEKTLITMFLKKSQYEHVLSALVPTYFLLQKGPSVVLPTGRRAIRKPVRCGNIFFCEHLQGY